MAYSVERTNQDVLTIRHENVLSGWSQRYLLLADVHWDNPLCRRDILDRLLKQAREYNAGIFVFGDWFCGMQGRWDPRANKEMLRPEHRKGNYLDALVDTATEYLEPYADLIVMMSDGNHETSIRKHLETDLLARLCKNLNTQHGGYSGFLRFLFQGTEGRRTRRNGYWNHGTGGGGPVTKGVIQTNRRSVYLPDVHYVFTGHIHEEWNMTIPRVRLSHSGEVYQDEQVHVQLPTLKDEFTMSGGWHVERGAPPKPLGGAWLEYRYSNHMLGRIESEVMRAK